jgi:hypothetical protein
MNEQEMNKPLTMKELLIIVLCGHVGVRKREQREKDFERADGLQVFMVAALYFAMIVVGLVFMVVYITA